jgi:hypothetical protein
MNLTYDTLTESAALRTDEPRFKSQTNGPSIVNKLAHQLHPPRDLSQWT